MCDEFCSCDICIGCISGTLRKVHINQFASQQFLVELCVSGVWTRICALPWTASELHVVCRELGYSQAGKLSRNGSFNEAKQLMSHL